MKKTLTGFAIVLVAALWMTGSWVFFNSIANGAESNATSTAAPAESQVKPTTRPMRPHHWKGHRHRANFWKQLDLTQGQRKQIRSIREQARSEMRPLIKELRAGHKRLVALRKAGRFEEAKVRAIAEQQAKTLTNVIVDRERTMHQIRTVLTAKQRMKLDRMRESWKAKHHLRHW